MATDIEVKREQVAVLYNGKKGLLEVHYFDEDGELVNVTTFYQDRKHNKPNKQYFNITDATKNGYQVLATGHIQAKYKRITKSVRL